MCWPGCSKGRVYYSRQGLLISLQHVSKLYLPLPLIGSGQQVEYKVLNLNVWHWQKLGRTLSVAVRCQLDQKLQSRPQPLHPQKEQKISQLQECNY